MTIIMLQYSYNTENFIIGGRILAKRVTFILIILFLVLSNAVYGAVPTKVKNDRPKTGQKIELQDQEYSDQDKVRVIVELDGETAVQKANKIGKRYALLQDTEKDRIEQDVIQQQNRVVSELNSNKLGVEVINNFTTVVNGFSAEVSYEQVKLIEQANSVAKVYISHEYKRPEVKPEMRYSKELIEAQRVWDDYGYKGKGMVVGVIDTGIDVQHKDMVLSEDTEEKLTKAMVDSVVAKHTLPGKFYTEKVPYAYNYMDQNDLILDLVPDSSMHGMHVSGIVGANGDEENGGIKGVAPEAQILGMKVFGNDPNMQSTYSDIYVKAIDDAIKLEADVINMSLGSTSAFVAPDDPEQKAIKRAVENGVLMAISAGNSAHFGNGFANPMPENPDIGVAGSPGISYESLQVASYENTSMNLDAVTYSFGDKEGVFPFLSAGNVHPNDLKINTFQLMFGGLGNPEELTEAEGKFALIERGDIAFTEKALNAQDAGALGVIIYNNIDGYLDMQTDEAIVVPQLFMLKSDGELLVEALENEETVNLSFNGQKTVAPNPSAGKMSAFTSWGVTPNLDFKPEITAPGGQILSTLQDNKYGSMSGTSMAAPHVAGGSTLILERVVSEFGLENAERVQMTKNLLMNTAKPQTDKGYINNYYGWDNFYSPRRQGAGLMQLHAALSTPAVVVETDTNEAKVALKEVNDTFEFELTLENFSDKEITYEANANLQTDLAAYGELGWNPDQLEAQELLNSTILVNGKEQPEITVAANSKESVTVYVDISEAKVVDPEKTQNFTDGIDIDTIFSSGFFVEGFVVFTDVNDKNPELSIPYVGFNGEWDEASIIDLPQWEEKSFYGKTGLVDEDYHFLGYDLFNEEEINPNYIAFSPNGDGKQDRVIPVLSLLRNAKQMEYNILDHEGNELRTLRMENDIRKHYYDAGLSANYTLDPKRGWDGLVKLATAAEGEYLFEIRSVVDYPGAEWQSLKIPVKVDLTAPELEASYEQETQEIIFSNVIDPNNGSGVSYLDILVDGESIFSDTLPLKADTENYSIKEFAEFTTLEVIAHDYAGNSKTLLLKDENGTVGPDLYVDTPKQYDALGTREVEVAGYVNGRLGIEDVKIGEKTADVVYNEETKLYEFSAVIAYETDGVKQIEIEAVDDEDKELSITRTVFVDSTKPTITVKGAPAETDSDMVTVSLDVTDNYDQLKVTNNDDIIFNKGFEQPYEMRSYNKTIENVELSLENGENTFVFEVIDLAGHSASETISITKRAEETDPGDGNGGGGGTNPIPPPTPPALPVPPENDDHEAVLDVPEDNVNEQINDTSERTVTLDLSSMESEMVTKLTAKVTKDIFNKIVDSRKPLLMMTAEETVELPVAVLEAISNESSDNIIVSIEKLTDEEVPAAKGQNLVSEIYDFSILLEKNGSTSAFSSFAEPVKIAVPVNSEKVTDPRKVSAYYFHEEDLAWEYAGGKMEGNNFTFAVNHFSAYGVVENDITFKDIISHWAKEEIEVLASRSIINGKTSGSFAPEEDITRAQFAALLVRSLNLPVSEEQGSFKDVSANHWAASDIEAAYAAGIISGKLDGSFAPSENITREQMAAMLIRAVQYKDASLLEGLKPSAPFKDADRINSYAKEAIDQAVALKLLNGNSNGTFGPKKNTTRAQAAVVLYRMLDALDELE